MLLYMLNLMSGLNWLLFIIVSFVSRKPMITDIRRLKSISLNDVQCNTTSRPIFFFCLKLQSDKNLKPSAGYPTLQYDCSTTRVLYCYLSTKLLMKTNFNH